MIFTVTYNETCERMVACGFPSVKYINPYKAIHKCLSGTEDTVIFVVTRQQLDGFANMLKANDLEKFLIVDHRNDGDTVRGVTNRNYPDDRLKLKLFVLKGKGNA